MVENSSAYDQVIADLKRKRAEIDAMIASLAAMAGGQNASPNDDINDPPASEETQSPPEPGNNPYLGMSIGDATVELLRRTRGPMSPTNIARGLEAGGLLLSGSNKAGNVTTTLTRRQKGLGDVVRPERGKWGLKKWYRGRNFGAEKNNSKDEEEAYQATATTGP